jgi:hypothetical protein
MSEPDVKISESGRKHNQISKKSVKWKRNQTFEMSTTRI